MIGIFKTNICTQQEKNLVIHAINGQFATTACSVDLEDCDKVLRVICATTEERQIVAFVRGLGYQCSILE
ncbi:hypothetical protein ACWKWU_20430 [Chitinophaga lutea]